MVSLIVSALSLFATVSAHLQLNYPPSFNASNNPHTTGNPDPFLFYPYNCCGRTTPFPCRGYLDLLGTPAGAPVVSWAAGSKQDFSLTGMGKYMTCVGFQSFNVALSNEFRKSLWRLVSSRLFD